MEVPTQECTDVEKVKNTCDPGRDRIVRREGTVAGASPSWQQSTRVCERRAEAIARRECNGGVAILERRCDCQEDDGSRSGVSCNFSVEAECQAAGQTCEDVKVVENECKTVRVQQLVCEKR
jgi:hypothetical protein